MTHRTSSTSPRPTRRLLSVAVAGAAALLLAGCAGATPASSPEAPARSTSTGVAAGTILDRLGAGTDVTRAIETLDQKTGERQRDVLASVRYDTLVLADDSGETSVPIPGDRFYLSVAPYVDKTHECFYHSLTTCQGELVDETVEVTITDSAGAILVDGPVKTYPNGFVAFWLPRDIAGTIRVSHEGRTATGPISTGKDAPTCLTTLQLT